MSGHMTGGTHTRLESAVVAFGFRLATRVEGMLPRVIHGPSRVVEYRLLQCQGAASAEEMLNGDTHPTRQWPAPA
jgi:hypothetical protein